MSSVVDSERARLGLREIATRQVAVIGEGVDVCTHALCIRDAGLNVRVGLLPDDPARAVAANDGLVAETPLDACEDANLVIISAPGHRQEVIYAEHLEESLVPGDIVVVTDPLGVRYEAIEAPEGVDVMLVMPTTTSATMRREFGTGHGVPMLVAVHQDASRNALERAAGVALALGGTRASVVETSIEDCADVAAMSTSIVWGDIVDTLRRSREFLQEQGMSPQVAYLLGVGALAELSQAATHEGLVDLNLDPWQAHVVAATRDAGLEERLTKLRNGRLARDFALAPQDLTGVDSPAEEAGRQLRTFMPWLHRGQGAIGERWR